MQVLQACRHQDSKMHSPRVLGLRSKCLCRHDALLQTPTHMCSCLEQSGRDQTVFPCPNPSSTDPSRAPGQTEKDPSMKRRHAGTEASNTASDIASRNKSSSRQTTDTMAQDNDTQTPEKSQDQPLPIIAARRSDVSSLSTILARSFHPTNPYIRRCFPDTPALRRWWTQIFTEIISDSVTDVLTCIQPASLAAPENASKSASSTRAVGVLCMRLLGPQERGAGFWSKHALTSDHDIPAVEAMIDGMVQARESMMLGRTHFVIELFGVENALQGGGVGARMLEAACKIADDKGHETFVQANQFARKFYERYGFVCKATKVLPGDENYTECMMIRPVTGSVEATS